jgi:hypothetical protein
MSMLRSIRADLLNPRILPVLVALSLALVAAIAYLALGGSSAATPPSPASSSTGPTAPGAGPSVSQAPVNAKDAIAETTSGSQYQRQGPSRDPFKPLVKPAGSTAATKATSTSSGQAASGSGNPGSSGSSQSTGTTVPAPVATTPAKEAPKPTHTGLTSTQAYEISLSLTNQSGSLNALDPLERLSVLPSGHRALFVVQPGTAVSGPGGCMPGPTDCEILSLAEGQIETIATHTDSGASNVAMFAVTAIKVKDYSSADAANHARREVSATGKTLLDASTLPALSLFEYRPAVGAVVDLRNLAVGGEK